MMKRSAHRAALVFPQFFLSVSAFQARYFFRLGNNAPAGGSPRISREPARNELCESLISEKANLCVTRFRAYKQTTGEVRAELVA